MLATYPWQTITIAGIIVVAYLIVNNISPSTIVDRTSREDRRQTALRAASMYLSPYQSIWSNLKLSNKYCSLRLGSHSSLITARDSQKPGIYFIIKDSKVHSYEDLWNMFCLRFSYNTTFNDLVQLAERFEATIKFSDAYSTVQDSLNNNQYSNVSVDINSQQITNDKNKELIDVNNASEIELTALPGISIVMAKKLIKRREEIGGFKSVSDVCLFLKLKPHMQVQLEKYVCVKKMKGSINIQKFDERSVDI